MQSTSRTTRGTFTMHIFNESSRSKSPSLPSLPTTSSNYAEMTEESVAYFRAAAWTELQGCRAACSVYLSCLARLAQLLSNRKKYHRNNNKLLRPREHQQKLQECPPQSFDELVRRLFWHNQIHTHNNTHRTHTQLFMRSLGTLCWC